MVSLAAFEPVPRLQDVSWRGPLGGDAVRALPAVLQERRGDASQARHRQFRRNGARLVGPFGPLFAFEIRARLRELGAKQRERTGGWLNNRAENSHQPLRGRKRAMQRFPSTRTLQLFAAVHSSVHNPVDQERHLDSTTKFKRMRQSRYTPRRSGSPRWRRRCLPCQAFHRGCRNSDAVERKKSASECLTSQGPSTLRCRHPAAHLFQNDEDVPKLVLFE